MLIQAFFARNTRSAFLAGLGILYICLSFGACSDKRAEALALEEQALFARFVQEEGWQAVQQHESGIWYELLDAGDALQKPDEISFVELRYRLYLLPGKELIYESGSSSEEFLLRETIPAWRLILPLLGIGGSLHMLVPSALAYASSGMGEDIPPDSPLLFEIELIEIHPHF